MVALIEMSDMCRHMRKDPNLLELNLWKNLWSPKIWFFLELELKHKPTHLRAFYVIFIFLPFLFIFPIPPPPPVPKVTGDSELKYSGLKSRKWTITMLWTIKLVLNNIHNNQKLTSNHQLQKYLKHQITLSHVVLNFNIVLRGEK
jgi:hypothetical protein